jgi:hypothetical protein
MWCGDVCNTVYTVLPIGIKQEKVQGSENKKGGKKDQESSSIKSLLKINVTVV